MPNDNNSAPVKAASHANQLNLFTRAGVIATLKMMNQQLVAAGAHLGYDDKFIEQHQDLDALRDEMSTKAVAISRQSPMPVATEAVSSDLQLLRHRLDGQGASEVKMLCAQLGIERKDLPAKWPAFDDWVQALLTKPPAQVTAALDAMEAAQEGEAGGGEGAAQAPYVARPRP
jgi:hypothetical protein